MSLASRGSRVAARGFRQTRIPKRQQRQASSEHGHDSAHGESALHLPNANPSGNESFGRGLYFTLAAVPLVYITYTLASGKPGIWDGIYQQYKEGKEETARRELLHIAAMSQAIADKAEIKSFPRNTNGPELRYPEMFNHGSPLNVVAGHGTANLKELHDYMQNEHQKIEEARKARIVDGMITTVYDPTPRRTT